MAGRPSGRFRVEAFRVPTMKAAAAGAEDARRAGKRWLSTRRSVPVRRRLRMRPCKLRTVLQDKSVSFADYPNFSFSNGDVKKAW
jgi:hypothetical protein